MYKDINYSEYLQDVYKGERNFTINLNYNRYNAIDIATDQVNNDFITIDIEYNPIILQKYLLTTKSKKMSNNQFVKWVSSMITTNTKNDESGELVTFQIDHIFINNIQPNKKQLQILGLVIKSLNQKIQYVN